MGLSGELKKIECTFDPLKIELGEVNLQLNSSHQFEDVDSEWVCGIELMTIVS
jgi:hypothetical protein